MVEEAQGMERSLLYGVTALGVKYQPECCARLVYAPSSSSSALASCRSAVSKPSVNQP
jgi:hypothetical protein